MDEHFRGRGIWIGLGALTIIFLCLTLCGFGAMVSMGTHRAPVYVQPSAGEEGIAPPPPYYGYGPYAPGPHTGMGPFGFFSGLIGGIFKLAFLGLLLLLLLGLVKRVFFGHRHWGPPPWGKPPQGGRWKGRPHGMWGPWAWHCHGKHWEPESDEGEPTGDEGVPGTADFEYTGPQE